ncbi:MAG: hypothetical protein EHM33_29800, partial [Chloroflexi bacterium]
MKTRKLSRRLMMLVSLLTIFAMAAVPTAAAPETDKEIVGYFIEWGIYGRNYRVKNIVESGSADKLTIIN